MSLFGSLGKLFDAAKGVIDEVQDRSDEWSNEMESFSFGDEYAQLASTTNTAMNLADEAKQQAESNMASLRQAAETAQQQALAAQTQGQALQTLADSTLTQAQSNIATLEGNLTTQVNQQLGQIGNTFTELTPLINQISETFKNDLNEAVQQIINEIKNN